eukprot:4976435-Pyramimonas_sp.AAC.1
MCWEEHYIDLILSYPSVPHTEPPHQGNGRYLPFVSHGRRCYLTCHSHFRLGSGAGRALARAALALLILALHGAIF